MKKIYTLILLIITVASFSQNSSCSFSDGNYHYFVSMNVVENSLSVTYDKADFISHLEINSNITNAEIQFLNTTLIEVFRGSPNSQTALSKNLYIISNDDSLDSFLMPLTESVNFSFIYCDCIYSDNLVHYYSRLIMANVPDASFDKEDYIQHIESNSNISSSDVAFLNAVIMDVYQEFPSSNNEDLQRILHITASSDLLVPFLHDYTEQALEFVENLCAEPELSTDDINRIDEIQVIPNPIIDNFEIHIGNSISVDKLTVYDVYGKIVIEKHFNDENGIIKNDFRLNSGLYFFKFFSNNKIMTKKIIVK